MNKVCKGFNGRCNVFISAKTFADSFKENESTAYMKSHSMEHINDLTSSKNIFRRLNTNVENFMESVSGIEEKHNGKCLLRTGNDTAKISGIVLTERSSRSNVIRMENV